MGSFLHVVALRFNTGGSLFGRSQCFSCSVQLRWYELIPVISYLVQKTRCRSCSVPIPFDVFVTELSMGFVFLAIAARAMFFSDHFLDPSYLISTAFLWGISCLLLLVALYDLRHFIIPDILSGVFAILSFVALFFFDFSNGYFDYVGFHIPEIWDLLAAFLIPLPFALIWLFSKGTFMGLGDAKLMVGMGFLLGLARGISAVFIAFWTGSLVVISFLIIQKVLQKNLVKHKKQSIMKMEIPFAPFLIIGTFLVILCGINLFTL